MKVGLNIFPVAVPELVPAARLGDELGYQSLWYGEHVAVPWEYEKGKYPGDKLPFAPTTPFLEIFSVFAHLAAHTDRIRLSSGIAILTVREPFITARAISAVDILSAGRLDLGVGTGWLEEEFNIMAPHREWKKRGRILEEFLEVLETLWSQERPEYHGEHFDFPAVGFEPKPVQRPRVPIIVGGWGDKVLRRAARYDGYYGAMADPDAAESTVSRLRQFREEAGLGDQPFEISTLKWSPLSRAELDAYDQAGVDQVVVTPWEPWTDPDKALAGIAAYAQEIGLA